MKRSGKIKSIFSLVAVCAVIMSLFCISASAATPSDAKNSVVVILSEDGSTLGSGFAIGEVGKPVEYVVTNNHVVQGEDGFTTATVIFSLASNQSMTANVYYYNAEKDIAVLRLPEPTDLRSAMVLCPMEYVDADDTFAALGYPAEQATDWPKYNIDDITITKGGIKKADRLNGQDVYMLDLAVTYGNSGGPLVNSDGEVVGINTFGANGENYALAIDELLNVIDTDRIPVTLHGNISVWLLVGGGAVLLVIIVLVIILILRKKNSGDYEEGANYTTPVQEDVNMNAKRQFPVANNRATARIIAIGGTLNGKKFDVSGSMKMGRDSSKCGIAFPVNTQGVSGVHCEIAFDGTVCYIKDLGSSYGTFTMDGRKMAPNVPQMLKTGEKFYLASPENTFEVRF